MIFQISVASSSQGQSHEKCLNCMKNHLTESCELPSYVFPCSRCQVVSFDGKQHVSPCMPISRISSLRTNLFAKTTVPMFHMMFNKTEADVVFLDFASGQFQPFNQATKLINVMDGLFDSHDEDSHKVIEYKANYFARFSVLIAVYHKSCWRLRFRAITTNKDGLLIFKMRSTMNCTDGRLALPQTYLTNATAVFGLIPKSHEIRGNFRVFANGTGNIQYDDSFNGYDGFIEWRSEPSEFFTISAELNGDGDARNSGIKFCRTLQRNENPTLVSFISQRNVPAISFDR